MAVDETQPTGPEATQEGPSVEVTEETSEVPTLPNETINPPPKPESLPEMPEKPVHNVQSEGGLPFVRNEAEATRARVVADDLANPPTSEDASPMKPASGGLVSKLMGIFRR